MTCPRVVGDEAIRYLRGSRRCAVPSAYPHRDNQQRRPFFAGRLRLRSFRNSLLALAVVFTSYSAQEIREARSESRNLAANLSLARADGERWRAAAATHANGLGFAIRQQFAEWRLTASECDVAILMLKDFHTRRSPISGIRAPQPFVSRRRRSTANPASQAAQSWLHTSSRTCSRRRKIAATAPPLPRWPRAGCEAIDASYMCGMRIV